MNSRRIFSQIVLVVGALLFSIGLQTLAFTQPPTSTSDAGAFAPITTGPIGQAKKGGLVLNTSGAANGLIVQNGNVGIRTAVPGSALSVNGGISVGKYHDTAAPNNGMIISGNVGIGTMNPLRGVREEESAFAPKVEYGMDKHPRSISTGDFNGDGKTDLLVGSDNGEQNPTTVYVSVLFNKGGGTFTTKGAVYSNIGAKTYSSGDFNGDGKTDLLSFTGRYFYTSISNGDGTFAGGGGIDFGPTYYSSVISHSTGDFNGDGKTDLAVVWIKYGISDPPPYYLSVFDINKGNGVSAPRVDYGKINPYARTLSTGDFNGDSKTDLVVANYGEVGEGNTISVILNKGNGAFAPKVDYTTGPGPRSFLIGDFNGDGKTDLVVSHSEDNSIFINKGDGTFAAGVKYTTDFGEPPTQIDDLNGDGKEDYFTVNSTARIISVSLSKAVAPFDKNAVLDAVLSVNGGISAGKYSDTAAPDNGMIIPGDVGIGTKSPAAMLSVAGGVQIGDDTSACTEAKAGTLRFHLERKDIPSSDQKPDSLQLCRNTVSGYRWDYITRSKGDANIIYQGPTPTPPSQGGPGAQNDI